MTKRTVVFAGILLTCFSGYAYIRFHKPARSGLSNETLLKKWLQEKPDHLILQTGDLIFRHGRGAISNALKQFSRRETKYSHAGIISIESDQVFVYHAIGGEENRSNKLRKDPIELFCSPKQAHEFGIYRLDLDTQLFCKMDSLAKSCYQQGLEFDPKFNMNTDDKMYCSEFVYKVIAKTTGIENYLPLSMCSGVSYVACDDLYYNAHCLLIYSYHY